MTEFFRGRLFFFLRICEYFWVTGAQEAVIDYSDCDFSRSQD